MNHKTLIIITVCLFIFAGIHGASVNSNADNNGITRSDDIMQIDPKTYKKLNAPRGETEFYRPIYVRTLLHQRSEGKSLTIR